MATNEELVEKAQQLYVSYYGRPADPAGLEFWADYFSTTDDVDQALEAFGTSQEFLDLFGGLSDEQLITNLYQQMFNRDPDAEGLAFYTEQLETGAASLASIALDIANGAQNEDITILDNKITVANTYTEEVAVTGNAYTASAIDDARALLASVDETDQSVTDGNAAAVALVADLPAVGPGGEFTLDENDPTADYSGATSAVIVTLDGDSDEANFDVTLSSFDDTVILEEYKTAKISDTTGVDTLDTSEHSGTAVVSLLAGTFRMEDGADTFKGTISGVENVIGTDNDDTITGDNADNVIWGGEGNDTIKGGIGDDTFYFEDESELGTGTVDGQTDDDTLVFTLDEVDLSAVPDNHVAVENLVLTNADDEDEVTLILAAAGTAAGLGTDNFDSITGSSAVDTVAVVGDINVSGTDLVDVEVLAAAGNARTVTISEDTSGLALVGNADVGLVATTNNGILALAGGGTFDMSTLVLSGFRSFSGAAGNTGNETLVITQAAIDDAVGNAAIGTLLQERHIFENLTDKTDVVELGGNVDFTDFTQAANLDFRTLQFGEGDTVLFGDLAGSGVSSIIGGSNVDTLVVIPGFTAQDLTAKAIDGIENLVIDITAGNEGLNVTVDEGSLADVSTIRGEIDLIVTTTEATDVVDLDGIEVTEGIDLSTTKGSVSVTQSVVDGYATLGANGGFNAIMGGDLDLSAVKLATTANIKGTSGDDSLTVDTLVGGGGLSSDEGAAGFSVVLGAGNDTLVTDAEGGVIGNVDMGSGNNTVAGIVVGNLDLGDNSAKVLGANDGTNTVLGIATGTITGGAGADSISVGGALAGGNLGAGDDSFSGVTLAPLVLGSGNDTYTSVGQYQGAILGGALISGGSGNDTFNIMNSSSVVRGDSGNDVFTIQALAFGATIQDLNVGNKDSFFIDLVGSDHMTTVAATSMTSMSGTMVNVMTGVTMMGTGTTTTTTYTWSAGTRTFSNSTGASTTGMGSRTIPSPNTATSTTTSMTGTWVANANVMTMTATTTTGTTTTTTGTATLTSMTTTTTTGTMMSTVMMTNTVSTTNILMTTAFGFVSGTSGTTTSALAAALTANGGLRILNQQGSLVTIAPGEALGTTVALPTYATSGSLLAFLTSPPPTGIGTTSSSGVRPSLANTTYVVFAFTGAVTAGANLVAYLVTANTAASGTVTTGEISTVTVANITSDGLSAADIVLI